MEDKKRGGYLYYKKNKIKNLKRPRLFVVDVQIKQKYLSTFSPTDQPKILNHTEFFSSKLKALLAQPNPKSEIPNPNQTKQTLQSSPHASS